MTMQVIQHIELGSAAANITFSSIPQTGFTDLFIVLNTRAVMPSNAEGDNIFAQFNSITSGYSSRTLVGTGSTVASYTNPNNITSKVFIGTSASTIVAGSAWSSSQVYIPNYTSSANKSISTESSAEGNTSTAFQVYNWISAGLMSNTASISSIAFTHANGYDFALGSSATLFGIRSGSDGTTTVS